MGTLLWFLVATVRIDVFSIQDLVATSTIRVRGIDLKLYNMSPDKTILFIS